MRLLPAQSGVHLMIHSTWKESFARPSVHTQYKEPRLGISFGGQRNWSKSNFLGVVNNMPVTGEAVIKDRDLINQSIQTFILGAFPWSTTLKAPPLESIHKKEQRRAWHMPPPIRCPWARSTLCIAGDKLLTQRFYMDLPIEMVDFSRMKSTELCGKSNRFLQRQWKIHLVCS